MSVAASVAALALPGDNRAEATLVKWEQQLKSALATLFPVASITIKERENDEMGCSFILSKEAVSVYERLAIELPEKLGARWSVDQETVSLPGQIYASLRTTVHTVVVRVAPNKVTDPLSKTVPKFMTLASACVALCYVLFIIW